MSNKAKTATALVVLIIAIVVGGAWYAMNADRDTADQGVNQVPTSNPSQNGVSASTDATLTTSSSDSSDAALQSDMSSVNAQMTGLDSDSASANQSVNASQQ